MLDLALTSLLVASRSQKFDSEMVHMMADLSAVKLVRPVLASNSTVAAGSLATFTLTDSEFVDLVNQKNTTVSTEDCLGSSGQAMLWVPWFALDPYAVAEQIVAVVKFT